LRPNDDDGNVDVVKVGPDEVDAVSPVVMMPPVRELAEPIKDCEVNGML
jgi:hypothetical protein